MTLPGAGERVVVAGAVAQRPRRGGHTWVFLQYLLGLRRLGFQVLFLDRLPADTCTDSRGRPTSAGSSVQVRYLTSVLERFGLQDSFSLDLGGAGRRLGLSERAVVDFARGSVALLDFNGYLGEGPVLDAVPITVYVDIDPGFNQIWADLDLHDPFDSYDLFATVGTNVGRSECGVPTCGRSWIPLRQPVVLDQWPATAPPPDAPITSVATWRGDFGVLEYGGRTLGLKVHEFRHYSDLPHRTARSFECALDIDPDDVRDRMLLTRGGWSLIDPLRAAGTPDAYRDYIRASAAEFGVAKNIYVELDTGWFSDRSACYLASGRPVIVQDTGFSRSLPTGEGLLTFRDPDEACAAVEAVARDPSTHARAAREVAEEHFGSDRVLTRLMAAVGSTAGSARP